MSESVVSPANTMSFEDYLVHGFTTLKAGKYRKSKNMARFSELMALPKTSRVRKLFLEVLERKVAKELNLPEANVDWSQIDWQIVWDVIMKLMPLLSLLLLIL